MLIVPTDQCQATKCLSSTWAHLHVRALSMHSL